jgi:hypothetical protein
MGCEAVYVFLQETCIIYLIAMSVNLYSFASTRVDEGHRMEKEGYEGIALEYDGEGIGETPTEVVTGIAGSK